MKTFECAILIIILFSSIACNRYVDNGKTERKIQIQQSAFTFFPDYNFLVYKSNVGLKMDDIIIKPKSFEVRLPKKIKSYTFSNSTNFYFYYNDEQAIFIKINLERTDLTKDTFYTPNPNEVTNIIHHDILGADSKYNINKIELNTNRKQTLIQKGAATILLYNIKADNQNTFFNFLNSFKFIS